MSRDPSCRPLLTVLLAAFLMTGCGGSPTSPSPAPRISVTRFVAFGDSITEGKLASGVIISNSYPANLQAMLAGRYTAQTFVVLNRGVGGERASQGVARLPGVLSADAPEVLLLLEGVNDLFGGDPSAIPPMIDALRQMVRQAHGRGVQVFLGTLLPERAGGSPDRSGALPLISAANDQIRQVATVEGATLVDLYHGFGGSPDPDIGGDGLHPTESGYQKIAELFFEAIRTRLEVAPVPPFMVRRR